MKNYIYILLAMSVLTTVMTSCSDDEDTTPSYADINNFAPAEDDNSETAQIRRDFYKETGCYLFFTDMLTPTPDGKVERLDLEWNIIGINSYDTYTYDFITDIDEQRTAADLLKTHLVKRLGKKLPFSFLLVNSISYDDYGYIAYTDKVLGVRTYAISMSDGDAYDNPDAYFSTMMKDIVSSVLKSNNETMEAFYEYSNQYYGNYLEDFGWDELTDQEIWDLGMFSYVDSYWGGYFVWNDTDLKKWIDAVFSMTREEFEDIYGSSATMMNKYDTLTGIINDLGFIIR